MDLSRSVAALQASVPDSAFIIDASTDEPRLRGALANVKKEI